MIRMILPMLAAVWTMPSGADDWVPFTLTAGNQIRFGMTVNGVPVAAILDTGVSHSVLSPTSRIAGDRRPAAARAEAIGGEVAIGWITVAGLAIGGRALPVRRIAMAAIPAAATGETGSGGAGPVDLLIGLDLTGAQAIDIDYPARRFRLVGTGARPFRGVAAPLTLGGGVVRTAIRIGAATLAMVVDTGDGAAVTVTRAGWDSTGFRGAAVSTTLGIGLAGPIVTEVAHAAVAIGDASAREVEVRIEAADGLSERTGVAGRIGSGLLGRYRVLLDPSAGRMILAAGPQIDRSPLASTTGLIVAPAPGALRILHVMRDSPAAEAGMGTRDRICAVDGVPVAPGEAIPRWPVAAPGTAIRLTLCDGAGERRIIARAFY